MLNLKNVSRQSEEEKQIKFDRRKVIIILLIFCFEIQINNTIKHKWTLGTHFLPVSTIPKSNWPNPDKNPHGD